MTFTNWYIDIGRVGRVHWTFSLTQFALGVAYMGADTPGQWLLIIGPFVASREP